MATFMAPPRRGGDLIDAALVTTNQQRTGAGTDTLSGLGLTITTDGRPVILELVATSFYNSSASGITVVSLKESSTTLATATNSLSTVLLPLLRRIILSGANAPSAGSHSYSVTLTQSITGNSIITASSTEAAYLAAYYAL